MLRSKQLEGKFWSNKTSKSSNRIIKCLSKDMRTPNYIIFGKNLKIVFVGDKYKISSICLQHSLVFFIYYSKKISFHLEPENEQCGMGNFFSKFCVPIDSLLWSTRLGRPSMLWPLPRKLGIFQLIRYGTKH